jgi:hypothetical protein
MFLVQQANELGAEAEPHRSLFQVRRTDEAVSGTANFRIPSGPIEPARYRFPIRYIFGTTKLIFGTASVQMSERKRGGLFP